MQDQPHSPSRWCPQVTHQIGETEAQRGEKQPTAGFEWRGVMPAVLIPQIIPKSIPHRPNGDPRGIPGITRRPPRDPRNRRDHQEAPGHHTDTQKSCPMARAPTPVQDAAEGCCSRMGGGMEAAMANPNSLSQAAINIPVFPKRGRRLSSSAPA